MLRAKIPKQEWNKVYVIPNAIVAIQCKRAAERPVSETRTENSDDPIHVEIDSKLVTIVVVSRLAYRKGIDLLVATAPRICAAFSNVRFLVGKLHFLS